MKRNAIAMRPDWRARIEAQGLLFHSIEPHRPSAVLPAGCVPPPSTSDNAVYWGEGTYYEFTVAEADAIERATRELHALCVDAVGALVERGRLGELGLSPLAIALVERSWREQPPSLYGRFDLAFGDGVPKMLEYNADTPTSLLEAAVIQWTWLAETMLDLDGGGSPAAGSTAEGRCGPIDQQNRLHDALLATWRQLAPRLGDVVHFACVDDIEDRMTVGYLRDTAEQAGLATAELAMADLGWDASQSLLVDLAGRPIRSLFKLYPWEGLVLDRLAPVLPRLQLAWLEPAWKMVLSNKAILPLLWELYPGHPNLLPASREAGQVGAAFVKKPLLGREGSNVTIVAPGVDVATAGPYVGAGYVYQAYAELGDFAGMRPVIGSWVVGGAPAGIGIRETPGYVTSNTARFVPHIVR